MKRRIRSISTRLILSTTAMTILLLAAFAAATITMHSDDLMSHVRIHATQLSGTVKRSLNYSMLRYDREAIKKSIAEIGQEEGIVFAHVYNKAGEIIYSSNAGDVGVVVEKEEDGCIQCHASSTPVVELTPQERGRIFDHDDTRSFRVVTPIYNQKACSSDPCHEHSADQKVLGVLYITMDLQNVDEEMNKSTILVIAFTTVITIGLSVFLAFFVRRFVHNPVAALTQGVQRVAMGDLDHPIGVGSKTEIGELAVNFNRMTQDLKIARQEIEEWGRSLELRVNERTRELEEAQAQLLQSEKLVSLGKLSASVAHEINNPLMGVLTFIRTFQDWTDSGRFPTDKLEEFREYLDIMGNETMRISKIVRSLLAFARKSKMDRQTEQVNDLVLQSLTLLDHTLTLQEIDVDLNLAEDLPTLRVDGGQIQQTIMNLMLNAAEAMGNQGTLTVSSDLTPGGEHISVKVMDTGPGIPEEIMDRLFDPFFTTKEVGKGTGLGLPVAYGIIQNHGGSIKVRTRPGEGSEFEILLPVAESEEEETLSMEDS